MNQFVKSGIFVAIAALCASVAVLTRPTPTEAPLEEVGDKLFPKFTDVTQVRSLEIVRPDSAKDTVDPLRIQRQEGRWVIASHQDYPADAPDARDRIFEAALELQDLKVLDVRSDIDRDHKLYGVIEPTEQNVLQNSNEEAIGTLISVRNASGDNLAEIIVGKSPEGQLNQRFVRRPGQSRVYICEFDPATLSTKFNDWIEGNLFDFDMQQIKQIAFNDTRVDTQPVIGPGGAILTSPDGQPIRELVSRPRFQLSVDWNAADDKWSLANFIEFRGGKPEKSGLLENEELNGQKLNDVKNALNAIKIFEVEKIRGLSGSLKNDASLLNDVTLKQSLRTHGFYPMEDSEAVNKVELLSKEGGLTISMQDGLQYTLRFGVPAGLVKEGGESKLNRFLLVTVSFDPSLVTVPEGEQPQNKAELRKKAAELSRSFSWYYVISEDVYKQLHLSRFEIIKEKEGNQGFDIDDFRKLEREGIGSPQPDSPSKTTGSDQLP